MKKYTELTDQQVSDLVKDGNVEALAFQYRTLRDHHIEETSLYAAKDRSALLRMAGNIAGPMSAATFSAPAGTTAKMLREATAKVSIALAREIIEQVNGKEV